MIRNRIFQAAGREMTRLPKPGVPYNERRKGTHRMRDVLGRMVRMMVGALALCGVWASTAAAQQAAVVTDEPSAFGSWIPVLLFIGLIVAVAFKNPKRSHLD